ncbi:SIR2 family protein [Comamonas sp.]|uniref:SIR2 family protein n=1 Tax=Comamonas sp. TaxID=34028 RepID=UPI0028A2D5AE|nr:SIR2 family protein [Comamonas sp.]
MASDSFTPDLLDDFAKNRVAIFLGAGVSAGVSTRTGKPISTWSDFLESTATLSKNQEIISDVSDLVSKGDYLFACEILKDHFQDSWEQILKEEFEKIGKPSKLQLAIFALQQRLLITTNFDLFLENHWEKFYPNATHHLRVKNGLGSDCFTIFRDENPYLVKLHGSINNAESMIFSLSDYATKAHSNWQYSTFIETLLCTHTVVFIGFSMKDAAITNLLEIYAQKFPKNRPHYAFMPDFKSERKVRIMKSYRKLFVIPYSSNNQHRQLLNLLEKLKIQVDERKRLLASEIQL